MSRAMDIRSPVWRAGPQYNVCTQGASLGRKCFLCLNLQLPPRSPYPLILYKLNGVWVRFAHRVPRLPCNSTFGLFRTSPIRATHCKSFIQALLQILCVSWGSVHVTLHRTSPILGSDCFGLGPIRSLPELITSRADSFQGWLHQRLITSRADHIKG